MFEIFIFLFGLIIGSFLNCVIYRIEKKKSLKGRSFCPHCKKKIAWYDLFPVISFFILKGQCRNCGKTISWQYPLVEFGTGVLFVIITGLRISFLSQFFLLIISCLLIIIFVYDLKHMIIPDRIMFPVIAITFIYQLINLRLAIVDHLLTGFIICFLFLFIVIISKGKWMGGGDVKLAFLIGLLLGFPDSIIALFLSFLLGAIIGMILIIKKNKTLKSEVPFAPFLIVGMFIALLWADKIIQYYFKLFII